MERTLIIFKPDCIEGRHVGNVLDRFEKAGFSIVGFKMTVLTPRILREHYAHVANLPFYPEIETFMSSRPVIVMVLEGHSAIKRVRDLLGPTDSRKAPKGTIRGDFGTEMMRNVVHASDSVENAATEVARFFEPSELFSARQAEAVGRA
jgi:nucleoside-diphosphate kinase